MCNRYSPGGRSAARRKQTTSLERPRERVTTSLGETRSHAMDFYVDLFGAEQLSIESVRSTWNGFLSSARKRKLTLEELTGGMD